MGDKLHVNYFDKVSHKSLCASYQKDKLHTIDLTIFKEPSSIPLIEINYYFLISTEIGASAAGTVVIISLNLSPIGRENI